MPKILIVEDDPAVRDVVNHALAREGMDAVVVGDGEATLEHLRLEAEPFDLVLPFLCCSLLQVPFLSGKYLGCFYPNEAALKPGS